MKKSFLLTTSAAIIASGTIISGAQGFTKTGSYTQGQFTDVADNQWYASSVQSAFELGFMKGSSDTTFEPEGNMTVAEAVTIAARVNDAYFAKGTAFDQSGANWYDCYVKYATDNGIITDSQFDNYDRNITRAEMATVFAKAVPSEWLAAQNNVTEIPDVPNTNAYFDELKLLYNAGVIMGNDEFGTFKPTNNITRAEAAAIIGRVALPETRLTKTLTDANYDDAYYLVDHSGGSGMSGTASQYDTAWNYDNRNRFGVISNTADSKLSDTYTNGKVEVWRDTETVEKGLIGWDFKGTLSECKDGAYFKLTDDELNEVVALTVKNSVFHINGVNTGVEVSENENFRMSMRADLDANKVELYLYDAPAGTFTINEGAVSRMYIGIDEAGKGKITVGKCVLYKDYVVNDLFLEDNGTALIRWEVSGNASVVSTGGQSFNDSNSARLESGAVAKKSFNKLSGNVVYEAFMLLPEDNDTGFISLNSGDTSVAKLSLNNDGVFNGKNEKLRHHTNNIWQSLRIEADTVNGTVTYKVNGKVVGTGAFDAYANTVDNITVGNTSGVIYFDDAKVYMTHQYDDYVPTPKPVTDDGYDVILNMCSLWHEGQHQGWSAISAYPDIEPALGYYDEGLAEVADWEIKFMVENGIDVQHLCWFSPSSDINTPIKKAKMDDALRDGFFNAKYSDMMKFTFMWENSAQDCTSFEQFEKYIWSYWMDYYFLDDRFYTIDNKIVFTVWSYNNFITAFGGTAEGALEAVAWMNEDAKAHGFDGVMIFFADANSTTDTTFSKIAEIGGSAAYAYHWQQDGNNASATISRLEKNQSFGKLHIVPAVSVGFNNIGWSGERKDLISLSDHKKVLEHIKNDYLPKSENGWKQKTLIISTWNEYGEGTYVMPVSGLHGFGYLENIAEVISGDTAHANNIYPTENQKARLGHMYPDTKTSIKRLDYEKSEESAVPTKVLYSFSGEDFKIQMNTDSIEYVDGVAIGVTTKSDPAFAIKSEVIEAKGDINLEDVVALRITASGTNNGDRIYFTTKSATGVSESKSFTFNMKPSDELAEYIIYTGENANWTGLFKSFRLDIIRGPGTFKLKSIEFLGYDESTLPYSIIVNNKAYEPYFSPVERNGEVYVTAEAIKGFFSLHNYYYEWSRKTGVLKIVSRDNTEVTFTVGSDIALVNGNEQKLAEPFALKDGLPEIPLFLLYKATNTEYTVNGKTIETIAADSEYINIIANRKQGEWEFEVPNDLEGFKAGSANVAVEDGALKGESVERPDSRPKFDPMLTISGFKVSTRECNKIAIGMKHKFYDESVTSASLQVFFSSDVNGGINEAKSTKHEITGNSSDGFVEYIMDFSENDLWAGNITNLRIDPFDCNCAGFFEIDYFRFIIDPEVAKLAEEKEAAAKKAEEERIAAGIIIVNGDAEDSKLDKAFYGAGSGVTRVKDGENYVWKVTAPANKSWNYIRQNVKYTPGATYKVKADIKLLGTANDANASGTICCNAIYAGANGKTDHVVFQKGLEAGKWTTVEFEFNVEADTTDRSDDQFTFFSNPEADLGMSFLVDNILVQKLKDSEVEEPKELTTYQSLAEFETPEVFDGFTPYSVTAKVENGSLMAETKNNDPLLRKGGFSIDAGECNKIAVRMKHKLAGETSGTVLQIFFTTNTETSINETKSKKVSVKGNSSDDFIEYIVDFSGNEYWTGNITQIRLDPIDCSGSFEIDYVRFVK